MKFAKEIRKSNHRVAERTADALFKNLESVALAIEGSDLSITEDNFCACCKMHSGHQGDATGDQIRSSKTTVFVYAISTASRQ